jgi:protein LTV1
VEEKVGLLNRAAPHSGFYFLFKFCIEFLILKNNLKIINILGPRPDLDPDIVAALDDDFNFDDPDNELEDDFIAFANGVPSDAETEYVVRLMQF